MWDFKTEVLALRDYLRNIAINRRFGNAFIDADDLVQMVVMRALESEATFTPGTNLKAWLFIIMRNMVYSESRRRWRVTELDADPYVAANIPVKANVEDRLELADAMWAMNELTHEHREAIQCLVFDGMTYDEIAEKLNVPVGTIKSRVSRGRSIMQSLLANKAQNKRAVA